jgi:hypothetical protein
MSLVYCPECGHEISQNAVACPNCGRPINEPHVVVEERPAPAAVVAPIRRRETVPPWAYALMGLVGVLLIVILFLLFRGTEDDANVNVALNANRRLADANRDVRVANVPASDPSVTVPGSQTSIPSAPVETTVPGTTTSAPVAPAPTRGTVAIRAQIVTPRGNTQPARAARFYLLDKDIETILSEARVEPIEGNTLAASLGLAAVFPDRYPEFRQAAARALAAHAKYSGTTDTNGAARLANIAPNAYYLFAITRIGNGFALWNSPVSVSPGDNVLDLSPASVTEIES